MAKLKCECGGELKPAKLKEFDFGPFAGFPITLRDVPGYRCSDCRKSTLPGNMINFVLNIIAYEITRLPFRLNADLAKYLRKRLGATQAALADRIGIDRTTVADWERGAQTISPQHDFILRTLLIAHFSEAGLLPKHAKLDLGSVRRDPPKPDLPEYAIAEINQAMRATQGKPSPKIYSSLKAS